MAIDISITGIQEAQAANAQAIAAASPNGGLGRAIQSGTIAAHRYAVSITHVGKYYRGRRWIGGGSLRASHRMSVADAEGRVYIDPSTVNPITRKRPSEYGIYEHRRGFPHNFYERTVDERGAAIAQDAAREITSQLP
jgi:hypothetical protein